MPNTDAERLTALLDEHRHPGEFLTVFGDAWLVCGCGERIDLPVADGCVLVAEANALHAAHVAAVLAEAGVGDVGEVERVTSEQIAEQRAKGWPDFHPEDYCHRCGERNMPWFADRDDWLAATTAWAAETGREGICCPRCFVEMHEAATGKRTTWHLTPDDAHLRTRVRALADAWERDAAAACDGADHSGCPDCGGKVYAAALRSLLTEADDA